MSYFRIDMDGGVARLTLARPQKHNAFDDTLIAERESALRQSEGDAGARRHETVQPEALDQRVGQIAAVPLGRAPGACREAKHLVREIPVSLTDADMVEMTAVRIADIRTGDEASDGLEALLAKRSARRNHGGAR